LFTATLVCSCSWLGSHTYYLFCLFRDDIVQSWSQLVLLHSTVLPVAFICLFMESLWFCHEAQKHFIGSTRKLKHLRFLAMFPFHFQLLWPSIIVINRGCWCRSVCFRTSSRTYPRVPSGCVFENSTLFALSPPFSFFHFSRYGGYEMIWWLWRWAVSVIQHASNVWISIPVQILLLLLLSTLFCTLSPTWTSSHFWVTDFHWKYSFSLQVLDYVG
jgi:hypothetical protein